VAVAKAADNKIKLSKVFGELILLHILSTILLLIIYAASIIYIGELSLYKELFVVGLLILFVTPFTIEWFYQGIKQFEYITIRTILIRLLTVVFIFVLIKTNEDVLLYYCISAFALALNGLINIFNVRKYITFSFKDLELEKHLKPLLYIFLSGLAVSVYVLFDTVLLGFLSSKEAVGYYSVAVRINKIPLALISAICTVYIPDVAAAYQKSDPERLKQILSQVFQLILFISIPLSAGIFFIAEDLVQVLSGSRFLNSVPIVKILSVTNFLISINSIFYLLILIPIGKERLALKGLLIAMIISIVLNTILIPKFSYFGAAITNVITETAITVLLGHFVIKNLEVSVPVGVIVKSAISCLLFPVITYGVSHLEMTALIKTLLSITICSLSYFFIQAFVFSNPIVKSIPSIVSGRFSYIFKKSPL
jgi:O-antigen/teichoic acid export membrane protein